MNTIILKRHDGSPQPAAGGDFVTGFKLIQHSLPFLLTALLGHDQEKIKYGEDKNKGRHTEPPHTAATTELYCQ